MLGIILPMALGAKLILSMIPAAGACMATETNPPGSAIICRSSRADSPGNTLEPIADGFCPGALGGPKELRFADLMAIQAA